MYVCLLPTHSAPSRSTPTYDILNQRDPGIAFVRNSLALTVRWLRSSSSIEITKRKLEVSSVRVHSAVL